MEQISKALKIHSAGKVQSLFLENCGYLGALPQTSHSSDAFIEMAGLTKVYLRKFQTKNIDEVIEFIQGNLYYFI